MKHLFRSVVGVLVLAAGLAVGSAASAEETLQLRVLSYNIHHGQGVDGKLDLERIAQVIRKARPDLAALQEVDRGAGRTDHVDQPAELARLTGMHYVFGENLDLKPGGYGNVVLSRFPIRRYTNHALPLVDGGEQRGLLEVEVLLPETYPPLIFLATHLDHRRPDAQRRASARAINALAERRAERRAILAGDLNDQPPSATLRDLELRWTAANADPLPTFPVADPARQIDYIMYRPASRLKTVEVVVLDEAVASDHRAILAVLELR
jgi:endonuclease/exonuclease/phosphatase family metal-dependent hydrolase